MISSGETAGNPPRQRPVSWRVSVLESLYIWPERRNRHKAKESTDRAESRMPTIPHMTDPSNSKCFWAIIRIKEQYCNWSTLEDWQKMVALTVTKVIHATSSEAQAEAERLDAIPRRGPKDDRYAAFYTRMRRLREPQNVPHGSENPAMVETEHATHIGLYEAEDLQQEINAALTQHSNLTITLDNDADVLDLAVGVDVRVQYPAAQTYRTFSILSAAWVLEMVNDQSSGLKPWYCTGGPLCIVREITGQTVVDSVAAYLKREQSSQPI